MEVVQPNVANYSITTALLAALLNAYAYVNTIVKSGATYNVKTTDTRVLINKTVGSSTSVVLGLSANQPVPVLVRDLKGDASSNNITVTFTGGQLCDGQSSFVITTDFGGFVFNPLATGGWYLGSA